jgi:hypothetical protein
MCNEAKFPCRVVKPTGAGWNRAHLVLWQSDRGVDVGGGSTWELWLAIVTQPADGDGVTAGLLADGLSPERLTAIATECLARDNGGNDAYPVRLRWLCASRSGGCEGSGGGFGKQAILDLARGTCQLAINTEFQKTEVFSYVDQRLIGPEIMLTSTGQFHKVKGRSKLMLEAAVSLLADRGVLS